MRRALILAAIGFWSAGGARAAGGTTAGGVATTAQPPAPATGPLSDDLDGDGQAERVAVEGGKLVVTDAGGRRWGEVTGPAGADTVDAPAIAVVHGAGGVYVHARTKLRGERPRAVELVGAVR